MIFAFSNWCREGTGDCTPWTKQSLGGIMSQFRPAAATGFLKLLPAKLDAWYPNTKLPGWSFVSIVQRVYFFSHCLAQGVPTVAGRPELCSRLDYFMFQSWTVWTILPWYFSQGPASDLDISAHFLSTCPPFVHMACSKLSLVLSQTSHILWVIGSCQPLSYTLCDELISRKYIVTFAHVHTAAWYQWSVSHLHSGSNHAGTGIEFFFHSQFLSGE